MFMREPFLLKHPLKILSVRIYVGGIDRWVEESDLGSSYKSYTGYREVLGGKDDIGGPNQANFEALAFILWCQKSISEWFENAVNFGFFLQELPLTQIGNSV